MSRIQVPVADKPRQEIEFIAEQECRSVPVQTAVLVDIGLAAFKLGYRTKNGQLHRTQQMKVS